MTIWHPRKRARCHRRCNNGPCSHDAWAGMDEGGEGDYFDENLDEDDEEEDVDF